MPLSITAAKTAHPYVAVPWLGAMLGAWLAHAMFDMTVLQFTGAVYGFTASTSFANRAAAFWHMFSESFVGLAPKSVGGLRGGRAGRRGPRSRRAPRAEPVQYAAPRGSRRWLRDAPHRLMPDVTIHHILACATSRNALALIRHGSIEPMVIEALRTPPGKEKLRKIVETTALPVRALLREKGTPYVELGLHDPTLTGEELLDAVLAHPILINRPVVVTELDTRLCRPCEAVLDILPVATLPPFTKGDGNVVVDTGKCRG